MTYCATSEDLSSTSLSGKRLLLLFPHMMFPGGAMVYTLKLAEFLAERGATVGILTLQINVTQFAAPSGVDILTLNGPLTSSLRYWIFLPYWQKRINARIKAWQPDVLIPQIFPANWWGWLYKRGCPGIKLVWVCHEPSAFIHSIIWIKALAPFWKRWLAIVLRPFLAAADIRLSRHTDRIVANSQYTAGMVHKFYDRDANAVAYPGIDLELFRPVINERREGIITVARLTRFKRIDFLLRVFAVLSVKYPDLVFNIVGSGDDARALHDLSNELGISSRVIFHGSVDNLTLALLYRHSRLLLQGSVEEPFGMAPLEAIACGTPVVAHRSGGPLEIVDDTCGKLIDSLSVQAWSEAIDSLLHCEASYFERVPTRARAFAWESTLKPIVPLIQALTTQNTEPSSFSA